MIESENDESVMVRNRKYIQKVKVVDDVNRDIEQ